MEFDFCLNVSVSFCGLLMWDINEAGYVSVKVSEEGELESET